MVDVILKIQYHILYPVVYNSALYGVSQTKYRIRFGTKNNPCQIPEYQLYSLSISMSHNNQPTSPAMRTVIKGLGPNRNVRIPKTTITPMVKFYIIKLLIVIFL